MPGCSEAMRLKALMPKGSVVIKKPPAAQGRAGDKDYWARGLYIQVLLQVTMTSAKPLPSSGS